MKKLLSTLVLSLVTFSTIVSASDLNPATMMPDEWEQYRLQRFAVILAHPELKAQDDQLRKDIKAQTQKIEAAMIKADASVKPILAKVNKALKSDWKANAAGVKAITTADMQKLRAARAAALKENPDLVTANQDLLKKKDALDKKIDDVLVQTDAGLADFIKQLDKKNSSGQ